MKQADVDFVSVTHVPTAEFRKNLPEYLAKTRRGPVAVYFDEQFRALVLSPEEGKAYLEANLDKATPPPPPPAPETPVFHMETAPESESIPEETPVETTSEPAAEPVADSQSGPTAETETTREVATDEPQETVSEEAVAAPTCELEAVKGAICTTAQDKGPGDAVVRVTFIDKTTDKAYGPVNFCPYHWEKIKANPQLFEVTEAAELPVLS